MKKKTGISPRASKYVVTTSPEKDVQEEDAQVHEAGCSFTG
jgi:hypothetical protein